MTRVWHMAIKVDDIPLPVLFHECDAHLAISKGLECSCGECNNIPPTRCNCIVPPACDRCNWGETPMESEAFAISIKAQAGRNHA